MKHLFDWLMLAFIVATLVGSFVGAILAFTTQP